MSADPRYEKDGSYYSAAAEYVCPVCDEYQNRRMIDALAENQQLRDALTGLMDALVIDKDGNLCSTPEEWGDAWMAALAAVRVEEA